jgi:hypothetical protein
MDLSFLSKYQLDLLSAISNYNESMILPDNFQPYYPRGRRFCGSAYDPASNARFRVIIAMNLKAYSKAKTTRGKTDIVNIIESGPNAGFVKKLSIPGKWMTLDDKKARAKVGHALRDAIALTTDDPIAIGRLIPITRNSMRGSSKLPKTTFRRFNTTRAWPRPHSCKNNRIQGAPPPWKEILPHGSELVALLRRGYPIRKIIIAFHA